MSSSTSYLLGSQESEIDRLRSQARLFEREVAWMFDQIGAAPGGAAADIGCGPIGILPQLRRHVGPHGRVVGVDVDPVMLGHASHAIDALGLRAELVQGDAASTGLQAASFDLAHVRLVLVNVAHPRDVVRELVRIVRPGGVVAVEEIDWLSWQCEPPLPAWTELRRLLERLWNSRGGDPCIGRRLPALLTEAGVRDVHAVAHAGIDGHDEPYRRLITDFADRFAGQLVELGLVTAHDLGELVDAVNDHLERPSTIVVRAMTVQAWGIVDTRSGGDVR
jgi:SAM-dependent methyltransferase